MRAAPFALPLVVLPLLACACMPAVRTTATAPARDPAAQAMIDLAAARIQRCYQAPRVSHRGRQIVTVLAVRYAPDGSLAGLPSVVVQQGVGEDNRGEAGAMADAARMAVIRCAPLKLPAEHYRAGWDAFQLTFSPRAVA